MEILLDAMPLHRGILLGLFHNRSKTISFKMKLMKVPLTFSRTSLFWKLRCGEGMCRHIVTHTCIDRYTHNFHNAWQRKTISHNIPLVSLLFPLSPQSPCYPPSSIFSARPSGKNGAPFEQCPNKQTTRNTRHATMTIIVTT